MYDDVESDFWKEIFVHMQHKNMVRVGAERLTMDNCNAAFEHFSLVHPEIHAEITNSSGYKTWEIFVTDTVKLRLFIQSQIKGTLLQRTGGDLVKMADAKFFNNPFPEIEEFISKKDEYLVELHSKIKTHVRETKQQKLAGEFIKANLKIKYLEQSDVIWSLEPVNNGFNLKIQKGKDSKTVMLNCKDYIKQLNSL